MKPQNVEDLISEFAKSKTATPGKAHQTAINGKTFNAIANRDLVNVSKTKSGEQPATTISAYSVNRGLTLACHTSAEPGWAQACVEQVLTSLDLRGAMVSVGAENSNPKFTKLIRSRPDGSAPGDYILCIKNNNTRPVEHYANSFKSDNDRSYSEATEVVEARRDERIVRAATLIPDRDAADSAAGVDQEVQRLWPDAQCVVEVEHYRGARTNERNEKDTKKQSSHNKYYVSSRNLTADEARH